MQYYVLFLDNKYFIISIATSEYFCCIAWYDFCFCSSALLPITVESITLWNVAPMAPKIAPIALPSPGITAVPIAVVEPMYVI